MSQPAAMFLNLAEYDPSRLVPGSPPGFGQPALPHYVTTASQLGMASKSYLPSDEALIHSRENAERMRSDPAIMEPLQQRQLASALLSFSIVPEDEDDEEQCEAAKWIEKIVKETPRFLEMRRLLNEALWYGKYAVAHCVGRKDIGGRPAYYIAHWEPRHGDKFVLPWIQTVSDLDRLGIRVGATFNVKTWLGIDPQAQITTTEQGRVFWYSKQMRKTIILHRYQVEDGPFEDARKSGRINGVGLRTRVYWSWYASTEVLQRVLHYLDRSAGGVEVWRFPANNPEAEEQARRNALEYVGGGRSVVLCPVWPGENAQLYGVEHIEPGMAGVDAMLSIIKEYFTLQIKRMIIGQTLTSEADATGLGSGVADAHLATFGNLVNYDAQNLGETLTEQLVAPLQQWNLPGSRYKLRFKINTEADNVQEVISAAKSCWDMGLEIREEDLRSKTGFKRPVEGEDTVFNPQIRELIRQQQQSTQTANLAAMLGAKMAALAGVAPPAPSITQRLGGGK